MTRSFGGCLSGILACLTQKLNLGGRLITVKHLVTVNLRLPHFNYLDSSIPMSKFWGYAYGTMYKSCVLNKRNFSQILFYEELVSNPKGKEVVKASLDFV